jgi:soluble lytic murein transglycosylase-like protein
LCLNAETRGLETADGAGQEERLIMHQRTTRYVLAALLCLGAAAAQAEIFRYRDSRGHTVFTDRPISGRGYKLVWRSSEGRAREAAPAPAKRRTRATHRWAKKGVYAPMIRTVAKKVRLSPELLHAVIQAESAYDSRAKSSAGAMGLMQLMPDTARRYGVSNAWDPAQNLEGGARYLRDLLDLFKNNLKLALAAYNAGEGAVQKYGNQVPPYPETRNYVRKVIDFYLEERKKRNS